jgi:hypothetical protein
MVIPAHNVCNVKLFFEHAIGLEPEEPPRRLELQSTSRSKVYAAGQLYLKNIKKEQS